MKIKSTSKLTAAVLCLFALGAYARAQEEGAPRFEVAAQFSAIAIDDDPGVIPGCPACDTFVYKGVGGRFTYNVNDHLAVETEVNFFLNENRGYTSRRVGGKPVQALFGVKAGRRFGRAGVFAKARPGVISFGDTIDFAVGVGSGPLTRTTHFNLDVGGVFEVYPSRGVVLRVDAGDTIIRYGEDRPAGALSAFEGDTRHNFQIKAGVGFRF